MDPQKTSTKKEKITMKRRNGQCTKPYVTVLVKNAKYLQKINNFKAIMIQNKNLRGTNYTRDFTSK